MVQTKKRKQSSGKQQHPSKKGKQPKQDGQKAVSREINIPIDEGFQEKGDRSPHGPFSSLNAQLA